VAAGLLVRSAVVTPLNELPEESIHGVHVDTPFCISKTLKHGAIRLSWYMSGGQWVVQEEQGVSTNVSSSVSIARPPTNSKDQST
jgi:hypothetical protein